MSLKFWIAFARVGHVDGRNSDQGFHQRILKVRRAQETKAEEGQRGGKGMVYKHPIVEGEMERPGERKLCQLPPVVYRHADIFRAWPPTISRLSLLEQGFLAGLPE